MIELFYFCLVLGQTKFQAYGAETGEMPGNRKYDFWLTSDVTNLRQFQGLKPPHLLELINAYRLQ
jgi:hypothetical protein